ncbi:stage II sporulation protein D [Proteinivorax hydrogeniformans]|uniref:Stage II sporulation protein D n=1 Tax=Proteinivorax hydrogeniformans TaxID=1826727 RepID=A0AAU8HSZ8_9FIRM
MGKYALYFVISLLIITIIMPAILVKGCRFVSPYPIEEIEDDDISISVFFHEEDRIKEMSLEEYIVGVVAGEMPASFNIEALKSQAIVARTYAYNQAINDGCDNHPDADICTDYRHCQHWISKEQAKSSWSLLQRSSNWAKIEQSVAKTRGKILTYNGKPIDALYHSTCGGQTENSEDVFTSKKRYLRSTVCDYCEHSSRLEQTVEMTQQEFVDKISSLVEIDCIDFENELGIVQRVDTNSVKLLRIKDELYSGTEVRMALGLNSTNFSINPEDDKVIFNIKGYGHGVGLCQYGADGMANSQKNYEEILHHYYKDIEIVQIYEK